MTILRFTLHFSFHQMQTGISFCQLFILNGSIHFVRMQHPAPMNICRIKLQDKSGIFLPLCKEASTRSLTLTHQLMHQACISLKSPRVLPDTKVQRSLFLSEWGGKKKKTYLPISSVWDERDGRASPVVWEFCCRSPSFGSNLAVGFNGFWEEGTLAQITGADQGPSDWSIVFFHLSIKDEVLMEGEGGSDVSGLLPPPQPPTPVDHEAPTETLSDSHALFLSPRPRSSSLFLSISVFLFLPSRPFCRSRCRSHARAYTRRHPILITHPPTRDYFHWHTVGNDLQIVGTQAWTSLDPFLHTSGVKYGGGRQMMPWDIKGGKHNSIPRFLFSHFTPARTV